jgi:S-adenosylmethionine synthetase
MQADHDYEFDEETISDEQIGQIHATEQVTVFGFACKQSPTFMPLPIWLAHRLSRRLSAVRSENILPYLAPDGTIQVGVEYEDRQPVRIQSLTINASLKDRSYPRAGILKNDIMDGVINAVFSDEKIRPDANTGIFINYGGPLKLGGPAAHSGLTGRKIAVDTYGGYSRMSGSALSGKDPLRIDRVGAYAARYAAKNVVAAGLADECEVLLTYSIGKAGPVSIQLDTRETAKIPEEEIASLVARNFDFRLVGILKKFNLRKLPSLSKGGFYRKLAAFGHFGRTDMALPWELIDKADILKSKA